MTGKAKGPRLWQVRLAPEEDDATSKFADDEMISKNDVLRRALRVFRALKDETSRGGRLVVRRSGAPDVEVWLLF